MFRLDLALPVPGEDIFTRTEKLRKIRQNYLKASEIFSETVTHLAKIRPRDPNLGKWFFLWGTAEWFGGRKEKAIHLFKRAVRVDFTLSDSFYNIASIYESLEQDQDSKIYWAKYLKAEKEFVEEK